MGPLFVKGSTDEIWGTLAGLAGQPVAVKVGLGFRESVMSKVNGCYKTYGREWPDWRLNHTLRFRSPLAKATTEATGEPLVESAGFDHLLTTGELRVDV